MSAAWPQILTAGFDGLLVRFADSLNEPANRAALAFRAAVERASPQGVEECSTSLVSTYLRFDPLARAHDEMETEIRALLAGTDWYAAPLPEGRSLWHVPAAFGGEAGPQLDDAAAVAGLDPQAAIQSICDARLRVQTIGFAPGMPYLGALPEAWDIPRQTGLSPQVPAGGLCVAIRQVVLFPIDTPTGWRHVAQTALELFRADDATPFLLRPGDEVQFHAVDPDVVAAHRGERRGGARREALA